MLVRLYQQVHMIRHQTERDDFNAKPLSRPLEHAEIPRVIHVVDEHLTLVIAAGHHMMKHPWDVQSERSRHALREEQLLGRVQIVKIRRQLRPLSSESAEIERSTAADCCSYRHVDAVGC
jgi:hypothetical protein